MRSTCAVGSIVLPVACVIYGACGGGTLPLTFDAGGSGSNGSGVEASSGSTSGSSGSIGAGSGTSGAPSSGASGGASGGSGSSTGLSESGSGSGGSGGGSGSAGAGSSGGASGATRGSSAGGSGSGSGASGGASGSGSSSGSGSGSADGDASTNPSCPVDVPQDGAPCPRVGFECEYGTSPELACNQLAQCAAAGWTLSPRGACPMGICAPAYADITDGTACNPSGLICAYYQGTCNCAARSGPIVGGAPLIRWACVPADTACRSPRPDIGSPCSDPGHDCNYGACSGGIALVCEDGTWQEDHVVCPAL
jgi:hypothetical protein